MIPGPPAGDLALLGLPPEARELVGRTAYDPRAAAYLAAHPGTISHRLLLRLLLHRPRRAWQVLARTADALDAESAAFQYVADADCGAHPRFAWWTKTKAALFPSGGVVLVLLGSAEVAGLWCARRGRSAAAVGGVALSFCALAALAEIAAVGFGDGYAELGRHLVTASFYADATLGLAVLAGFTSRGLTSRRGARSS